MADSHRPPPGHFTLLYFASASSYTKKTLEDFGAPSNAAELYELLEKKYPGIRERVLRSCALTINLEYVDVHDGEANAIKEGDEVALIPPVSSG